ncbi:MAG TPA: EAL domain-containing protein, partial [Desulfuromonadales bacterium]|nr:EAL domain-containing protein [Desulfuromonadales bacterium]
ACDHGGGHPSENTCPACAVKKTLADGQVHREGKRLAQSSLIFKTTAAPVKDAEGIILSVVEISRDVTEEKKTEERLRQSEQRYANLFQGNASVMLVFEQKTRQIVDANPAACLFYGYTKEQMTSMKITEINVLSREEISREIEEARAAGRRHFRFQHRLASGDIRDVEVFSGPVVVEGQSLIYALVYDVTERVLAEKKLQYLALHDVLTGLANRSLLEDRLSQALIRAQRHGETGGVFFLDLDHFKNINDSLGHQIGDLLLQQVAERLGRALRREDTISRLGGDEFILLLPGIKDGPEAALLAAEILHKLARSYQLPGKEVFITSSLGISLYPSDSLDFGTLIRNADTAMYHAKSEGRNNFQFFRSEMTTAVQQRLSLEHDLRRALTKDEFRLYYQPQVDAVTGEFVGVEALIRWLHPERGVVPPADFIPIAEENGLIDQIGAWVLRTACVQNRQWQSMGCQPIQIACNVSGRQFRNPNFIDTLDQILKESGCDPQRLEIEVTENILMENIEQSIATLVDLKTRKISLAIDDFGTGYSSLNYLRVFPIDRLKIDRSFVTRVTENVDDVAIANAIISLARTLKLDVVAEGVETAEQAALLRELGCDKFQGYFFGRPVPADALPPWAQIKDSDPTSSNPTI